MGGAGLALANGQKPSDLKTPHTLEPVLPAVCEKNIFRLIRSSASGKTHFFTSLLPVVLSLISDASKKRKHNSAYFTVKTRLTQAQAHGSKIFLFRVFAPMLVFACVV